MSHRLGVPALIWILIVHAVFSKEITSEPETTNNGSRNCSKCDAQAAYNELMKVIEYVKASNYTENGTKTFAFPLLKKFQEDEDYGTEGIVDFPSIVPNIFKLVNSAISLNSSGLVEGSFGLLPENLSSRITNVLGNIVSILGPPTTTPRPRRRRTRRTTTLAPTSTSESTTENSTTTETATISSTTIETTPEPSTMANLEVRANATSDIDSGNSTEITEEEAQSSTDVLFKESALGELPVYAAAYAPNYVAATTAYPVYASNFLHILYSAPTTTTNGTTTTEGTTTSTDPNSYNIPLPFDYMEGIGIGSGFAPISNESSSFEIKIPPNTTYPPLLQYTPPEYGGEYEYEEPTEEATVAKFRDDQLLKTPQSHNTPKSRDMNIPAISKR